MGLIAWFAHLQYQPLFKKNRWHTECEKCGVRLRPRGLGDLPVLAASLLCGGLGFAVATSFGLPTGPYNIAIIAVALLGGAFVSYPLARYQLADSAFRKELPAAQVETDDT